jgi:transcriptional regulator with XRE-family HTH domain
LGILKEKRHNHATLENQPPGNRNLMRVLRRRLGLTQRELAYVIGYKSDSQISHIENGSRTPHLSEVLMIELVFGIPAVTIFPQIRLAVGTQVGHRLKRIMAGLPESDSPCPRMSYKAAQLERVLASVRSREEFGQSDKYSWHTKK